METIMTAVPTLRTEQKINLIEGRFTASEAADIINDVLKVKINFHKIQRLSITEGNLDDACEHDSSRIDELLNEQILAKDFFSQARLQGKKLKMTSTIHIEIEE
jgi:uncharacterized protein with FMN-binding domain